MKVLVRCGRLIVSLVLGLPSSLQAANLPLVYDQAHESQMIPLGKAVKRFLAFRVVTVDLAIGVDHSADQIFEDIPKRIRVQYHVNISKPELDRATIKGIQKNVSEGHFKKLLPKIEQINSYYPNVGPGDQITITYIPGRGSEVRVSGELKGVVPGKDFAAAFFSIWVGQNPVDPKAKQQLLGDAVGP